MATSKGKLTTVVTIVATAALVFGTVSAGFAQDAGQAGLRRLLLENRIAQVLNDLNLTEAQKSELKSILEQVKAGREEREAEAVKLLTERRDALLAGNDAAVREADRKIAALAQGAVRQAQELFKPFVEGLTERQRNLLSQLVPGLGVARVETAWRAHGEPRRYLRELPMVQRRRGGDAVPMPPNVRQFPQRPELPRLLDLLLEMLD